MGNTGYSTSRHLHVSVYPSGTTQYTSDNAVDPEDYIRSGIYPCNTLITSPRGRFGADRYDKNGKKYGHEGLDFSGIPANLRFNWREGASGSDGLGFNWRR